MTSKRIVSLLVAAGLLAAAAAIAAEAAKKSPPQDVRKEVVRVEVRDADDGGAFEWEDDEFGLFALGDEISVLTNVDPKGRKYTVNGLDDNGQVSCALNVGTTGSLIWTQQMALAGKRPRARSRIWLFPFSAVLPCSTTARGWTRRVA